MHRCPEEKKLEIEIFEAVPGIEPHDPININRLACVALKISSRALFHWPTQSQEAELEKGELLSSVIN